MLKTKYINYSNVSTLESRIIGGVGIIGGSNIVIIINNRGVGIIGGSNVVIIMNNRGVGIIGGWTRLGGYSGLENNSF